MLGLEFKTGRSGFLVLLYSGEEVQFSLLFLKEQPLLLPYLLMLNYHLLLLVQKLHELMSMFFFFFTLFQGNIWILNYLLRLGFV
jgi:hypothetical protein